jgi:tripartite-type tricarboxylate transporter receptor subunit TctC
MTRLVAQRLGEMFAQQFVIENRPGAGGIGACEFVARSAADGYTLLIADVAQTAINPALYAKLPYDPVKDFAPVSIMGTSAQFLVAHPSVPANTLRELIALAKAKPGQLNYGSGGIGIELDQARRAYRWSSRQRRTGSALAPSPALPREGRKGGSLR